MPYTCLSLCFFHQAPNFASGPQRPVHTSYRTPSLPLHKPLPTACALQSRTRLSPVPHPSPPDHIPNYSSRQQQSLHPYGLSPSDRSLDVNAQDQSPKERCAPILTFFISMLNELFTFSLYCYALVFSLSFTAGVSNIRPNLDGRENRRWFDHHSACFAPD